MTQHDAAADLAYIRGVMEQTRHYTAAKGGYFIVWGVVITLGLLGTWLQLTGRLGGDNFWVWTAAIVCGWIATAVLVWHETREPVVPAMAQYIGYNWMSVGLVMSIMFFVGVPSGAVPPQVLPGMSALLVGAGIFNTGTLSGMHWLRAVAGAWFLGGIYMFLFPGPQVLLAMAFLLIGFQIVPGMVLVKQARARRG
jgi:surface polysaccharide O-acyltransferase-like enzyme